MLQEIKQLHTIFTRTLEGINVFRTMVQPLIDHARDEHMKLYYHHISEEEEQREERLHDLVPRLSLLIQEKNLDQLSDRELSHLLSDLNLERFGLHNFREHLELALYEFTDEPSRLKLDNMRENTHQDYLATKEIMVKLSEKFSDVVPAKVDTHDHDHGHDIHQVNHFEASSALQDSGSSKQSAAVHADTHGHSADSAVVKKGLTVGSLRHLNRHV
ncbi:IMEF encapsulin system ferritin-like cargo protein [Brevibacillus laterosporus]|uniref:IMEF encapsulin system ferritin-like cargo protein n=1 Tax=Brevibacillus laterosporus TaxID=1465 RepID=UPI000E6C2F5F|nr:IMEF encapsulin system ferritin-like cargo protein [Brevibacillus laterosporus]AYB41261.1 hypothetical protein D5F52_25155 [Brevibacillus laterosporus]MBM7108872.1 hypothetical protein [Brevibacillus laterosporus]NKQ21760.1 hypothetical protein [Brevibacillus laterosporus]WNX30566.1 hypothetical protein RWW94_20580 [Brevibacillus laterosporus]